VIYSISESPHEPGVLWVGANDGPVHVTRDGGTNWKEVTPPGLGPYGRVQTVEVSPHKPSKAYVSILRYQVGDFEPHAYKTEDYGETWMRLTTGENGIPSDYPVRVVREDPDRAGLLYAGTEFGMFVSFDDGAHWQSFQLNLPVTPVTDLKFVNQDLAVSTMGRGFWMLYDLTPLHEIDQKVASARLHFFRVKAPLRLRMPMRFDPESPDAPQYPEPGAVISYYLAEAPAGDVKLEILDAVGEVVRAFSSEAEGEESVVPGEAGMREWRLERVGTPKLPKAAGMNRFVWDLRHPGPWSSDARRSGRGGPLVAPGTFSARLTAGDWSETVSFRALLDPRVSREGRVSEADVTAQVQLALRARDALSNGRHAADRLKKALETASASDRASLEEIQRVLIAAPVRYSRPMIVDQIEYLYENLDTADQKPGSDAYRRYEELLAQLQQQIERLDRIVGATDAAVGDR
jgi:hypothetical protein